MLEPSLRTGASFRSGLRRAGGKRAAQTLVAGADLRDILLEMTFGRHLHGGRVTVGGHLGAAGEEVDGNPVFLVALIFGALEILLLKRFGEGVALVRHLGGAVNVPRAAAQQQHAGGGDRCSGVNSHCYLPDWSYSGSYAALADRRTWPWLDENTLSRLLEVGHGSPRCKGRNGKYSYYGTVWPSAR